MPHYLMYRDLRVNFKKNPTVIMVLCYGTTYLSILLLGHYMRLLDLNKKLKNIILECFLMTIIERLYIGDV